MRCRNDVEEVQRLVSSALETTMVDELNLSPQALKIAKSVWSAWENGLEVWASQGVKADELWIKEKGLDKLDPGKQHDSLIRLDWDIEQVWLAAHRGDTSGSLSGKVAGIEHVVAAEKLWLESAKAESQHQTSALQHRRKCLDNIESEFACEIQLLDQVKQLMDSNIIKVSIEASLADDSNAGNGQAVELNKQIVHDDNRVVLVCMDPYIGFDPVALAEMTRHIESSRAIIPLIMPTYKIKVTNKALPKHCFTFSSPQSQLKSVA